MIPTEGSDGDAPTTRLDGTLIQHGVGEDPTWPRRQSISRLRHNGAALSDAGLEKILHLLHRQIPPA